MDRYELEQALHDLENRPILDTRTKLAGFLMIVLTLGMLALSLYMFFQ